MPLLGTLIVSVFTALFSLFGRYFVLEKAARLAAWGVALALIATMAASVFSCINGVCATGVSSISSSHPNFAMGFGIIINRVTMAAVGCYMTVWIGCQLYVIKKKAINMIAGGGG